MTEENQPGKKSAKPIGGISRQYASIGGKNAQVSERSDVQPLEHSNAQAASLLDAQKPKRLKREREKLTVYLDPEVNTWIRHRIADTREEISDVVNDAVRRLMQKGDN